MRFAEPAWFILLVLVPLPWLFARTRGRIAWPSLAGFDKIRATWASRLRFVPVLLRTIAIACLAFALARPQTVGSQTRVAGRGVEIVVALDNSLSMTAKDFSSERGELTRFDAARETFAKFVAGRPDDLIGLVVFANFPDRKCAPTMDHTFLLETVRGLRPAWAGDEGTNIGDAIAWSLGYLNGGPRQRKRVLILLTDGRNDPAVADAIDPEAAAVIARDLGVTLHTIAIGRAGGIVRGKDQDTGLPIPAEVAGPDLALLERLATIGGGQPFVAADADALEKVFRTIDKLERSPLQGYIRTRYDERFGPWVAAAIGLLMADRFFSAGRFRRLP
jgi:Ca-activated chloride channel family protein